MLIHKKSLADEVADRLQLQIGSGKFKTGDKLPTETELMKLFGVGRSSIREAIKILGNRGLLAVQQGSGTYVTSQTGNAQIAQRLLRANIKEVDEVRQILELQIAEKAAERRTGKDILHMKKALKERETNARKGLLEECIKADINFHTAVAGAAHNAILAELYKLVGSHLKSGFQQIYSDTDSFKQSHPLHKQLLQDIIHQNPGKAKATALKILTDH